MTEGSGATDVGPDENGLAQIGEILNSFPEFAIGVYPAGWEQTGRFDYLYRRGTILTRDGDAEAVRAMAARILRRDLPVPDPAEAADRLQLEADGDGRGEPGTAIVRGVSRISFPDDDPAGSVVPALLDRLDELLGVGTAVPEHVFHAAGHACSQTDPTPPPPGPRRPFPLGACDPSGGPVDVSGLGLGVRVGIVDTGLLSVPADLTWMAGVTGDPDATVNGGIGPYVGHGTFVAGCLRAMAPQAQVRVERGLIPQGGALYEGDLAAQVLQALAHAPDILIVSFVAETRNALTPLHLDVIYENQIRLRKNLQVFGPAGNGASNVCQYPGGYDWVCAVGALGIDWRNRASWSNYGNWVDVYAPGSDLINAFATGDYQPTLPPTGPTPYHFAGLAQWSGTSFATPLVAGMVAARMSATGENARVATAALVATGNLPGGARPRLTPAQSCQVMLP